MENPQINICTSINDWWIRIIGFVNVFTSFNSLATPTYTAGSMECDSEDCVWGEKDSTDQLEFICEFTQGQSGFSLHKSQLKIK